MEFNDQLVEVKETETMMKSAQLSRGEKLRSINAYIHNGGSIYTALHTLDPYDDLFGGYLISRVFNAYVILGTTKINQIQHKPLTHQEDYDILGKSNWVGKASLTAFEKLYKLCNSEQINPVYYLSAIFGNAFNAAIHRNGPLVIPYPNGLVNSYDIYKKQVEYDTNNYKHSSGIHHQTIGFLSNPLVGFLTLYFKLTLIERHSSSELVAYFDDDFNKMWDQLVLKQMEERYFNSDIGSELPQLIGLLEWFKMTTGEMDSNDPNFGGVVKQVKRVILQVLYGRRYGGRGGLALLTMDSNKVKSKVKKFKLANLINPNQTLDTVELQRFVDGILAFKRRQNSAVLIDKKEKRTYVLNRWWRYALLESLNDVGKLVGESLGMSVDKEVQAKTKELIQNHPSSVLELMY
ncbi:hypothetical protein GPK34_00655 [Secundilactobacillus kimchicus]|uniref:hypothetical protein n=1 Tax=Secundilactobacillus kimchicus TaxID=528209 RepID=UPI001C00A7B2|nr:hypothetical protein [Secundilactobacillus kimchicus]MBT9670548.1 hypothetical protein [Secundilactobacillus kimchicus]